MKEKAEEEEDEEEECVCTFCVKINGDVAIGFSDNTC